jgi:GNAT superfamily N-acetyltransferase
MTPPADLRAIAHTALCLTEPPYLKHYRNGRFKIWNGVAFTASELPGAGFNFAAVLHENAPNLDDLLPVARQFFAGCEQGWGVLVEGDAGHAMETELRARGWAVAEDEPAFVLEEIGRAEVSNPQRDSRLVSRVANTEADNAAYQRITSEAFQAPPEFADSMIPSPEFALDPDIALFVGSIEGVDVSAVGYSRSGSTAVLWGTATLEVHRGRGYGGAVSRAALAHAANRGCTNAALRSGPKSIPVYERLGFQYVCQHRTYADSA